MEVLFKIRQIPFSDWASLLFMLCFFIIAVNKSVFSTRFIEFAKLPFSNKYVKTYKDPSNIQNGFTVSMLIIQLISLTFFILLLLNQWNQASKSNGILFIQIITFLIVFIGSKFLIEKIMAFIFEIENFVESFNLQKVIYRSYIGFILLPVVLILYYNNISSTLLYIFILSTLLLINLLMYYNLIKKYQNFILPKIFYFILYLCAFEIAPYYFIYYWITKN